MLLWGSHNRWLQERFSRLAFVRRAVSRFMPGERADDALAACGPFNRRGIGCVLTLLGENVADASETREVVAHYAEVMDRIAGARLDAEISVKPTHLGLDLGPEVAFENLRALAAAAAARGNRVWVDMEGSAYTEPTIALFRRARAEQANVGVCLQAYLHRTREDLEGLLAIGAAIRLVKGAYAEPRAVAMTGRAEVDESFYRLAERMLAPGAAANGTPIAFGTHDPDLIRRIQTAAAARGVPKDAYEFQLLYGIRRDAQERLAAGGYRVRVLISYGPAWFPWYMRRLAERPANLGFLLRNLFAR